MKWKVMYNSLSKQNKSPSDRITHEDWNTFMNILAIQSNNSSKGLETIIENSFENTETIKELKRILQSLTNEFDSMSNDVDEKLDKAPIDNIPLINSSGKIDKQYYDAGSFGYEPDLETIILNDEEELKVSDYLKIDGGYL